MFSLHDKRSLDGGQGREPDGTPSWRPNVPERQIDLGRSWYGRKRKPPAVKPAPHGGYDRYAGYEAPSEDKVASKQRVDLSLSAFVLSVAALVLAWWPILKYVGVSFAVVSVILATRELARHNPASRIMMRGEAAHAERFARTGRVLSILAVGVVAGNMVWGVKTGQDNHAKATGRDTGSVLADLGVTFGEFSTGFNGIGQPTRQLPITVKNRTDKTHSFNIQIEAIDASAKVRIASDQLLLQSMAPGETREELVFQFADPTQTNALRTATFRVAEATEK